MFLTETELLLYLNIPTDVEAKFVTHVVCEGEKALDCYRSVLEHLRATVTHLTLNFPLNSEVIDRVARTCPHLTYLRVVEAIRDQPVWPVDCAITHLIYDDCMGIKYSELALPPRLKVLRISNVGFSFKKDDFSDGRFRDLEELEANGMQIHTKNKEASDLIGKYNAWLTQNSDENLCKVLEEREDDPRLAAVLWDKLYKLALEILPDHFRYMSGALIKQLFALVDNIYFGGSMNLTCPIRSGKCDSSISGITFDASCTKDTNAGTCTFWSKTNSLIVRMQAKMFLDIPTGSNRSANGLDCNSRLTCFLLVLQHEATHALLDLNCADQVHDKKTWEKYEGHTPTFVKITKRLYGHTEHTHSLNWEKSFTPPKTQEEAHELLEVATKIVEEDPDRAYLYIKKAWPIFEGSAERIRDFKQVEVQTMNTFIQARNNRAAQLAKDTTDPYFKAIELYIESVDFLEEHFPDEIVALYVVKTRLKLGDLYVLDNESEMAIEQFEDALKKCKPLPGGFRKKIEISMKLGELNDKSVSLEWYRTAAAYAKEGFHLLDVGEGFEWEEYQEYLVSIADCLKKDHPEEAMKHYKAAFEFKDTDKGDMLGRAFSGLAQLTHDHAEASELFGRAEKAYETKSMVERANILKNIEYYQVKDRSKDTETPMVNLVDTMSELAKWFEEHGTYAEVNDVCQDVFWFLQRNGVTDTDSDARVDTLLLLGGARVTEAEFLLGSSKANASYPAILLLREAEKELKEVAAIVTRSEDDTILHLRSEANDLRAEARSILYKHHKDDSHYKDAIKEYMKRIASDQPVYDGDAWKNMGDLAMMHATTYQHLKARTIEMKKLFADAVSFVWFGLVWFGFVWFGLVSFGLVWFGLLTYVGLSFLRQTTTKRVPKCSVGGSVGGL
jgi:tetratricopeptide (TPR) repeat protein